MESRRGFLEKDIIQPLKKYTCTLMEKVKHIIVIDITVTDTIFGIGLSD